MPREYHVGHSRDGWQLMVRDEKWRSVAVERAVEGLLGALGHPCCGKGLLSHLGLTDGDHAQLFWYRILNIPNHWFHHGSNVLMLPLTEEQAQTLHPDLVARWNSEADDDDDDDAP